MWISSEKIMGPVFIHKCKTTEKYVKYNVFHVFNRVFHSFAYFKAQLLNVYTGFSTGTSKKAEKNRHFKGG
jgi:hypothetical protein